MDRASWAKDTWVTFLVDTDRDLMVKGGKGDTPPRSHNLDNIAFRMGMGSKAPGPTPRNA